MAKRSADLLSEIGDDALNPSTDLPTLLRKCVALGGITGSERLRSWAALELKGYGPEDELPDYRLAAAPLLLDGITYGGRVEGQVVPANLLPDFAHDKVTSDIEFRQPIAELADLVASARARGEVAIRMGPPGMSPLLALINSDLAKADRNQIGGRDLPPGQIVERIYWSVSVTSMGRVLDVVRTTLVELVAEMRAGTPSQAIPTREIAEQAVDVAVYGKRNRVVITQVAPHSAGAASSGGAASTAGAAETRQRQLMWWIVGVATIVAAVAAVLALFVF